MSQKEVTMKDIAARLNVSISTVSRALQDHYGISEKVKLRVVHLAKELDFRPNPMAMKLRKNKSNIIGVVVPEIAHNYYSKVLAGMEDTAAKSDYNVMFCVSNESASREAELISTLVHSRVDGVLIAPSKDTSGCSYLKNYTRGNIPFVFFDRHCEGIDLSKVLINDYRGSYQAVQHLISRGRKHIAHIAGPPRLSNTRQRLSGYADALKDNRMPWNNNLVIHCDLTQDGIKRSIASLLSNENRPDAIFTYNSFIAFEGMVAVKNAGFKIPDDIAFTGFANEPIISYTEPQLTAVIPPAYALGQEAVRLLLKQINSKTKIPPETVVLETKFSVNKSSEK